jgi:uncharacterized protein YprB with RNaseH-like and TPR domain
MGETALVDRLRRLKRGAGEAELPPPMAPAVDGLDALEASLGGLAPDGLSLKQRLERLVAVAARRTRSCEGRSSRALEELIQGRRVENERGEFFLVEGDLHLDERHGDRPLARLHTLDPDAVAVLTHQSEMAGFDLRRAVFLDTETTGLAGGTGTAAFLVGIAFVDAGRLRLRQYFMRDYHEEPALLRALAVDLAGFAEVVTFNGKVFDLPLLESRYRLNRERYPLAEARHFDLLHPARRLWKARLESCRLQSLEATLLGVRRVGDVPGEEIPRIYFDFVRRRDGRAMARVLDHNRLDVLSLVALAGLACRWLDGEEAEDARDLYCLARVLERAGLGGRCEQEYERAVAHGLGAVRTAALLRLAVRARRRGDLETACRYWETAAQEGDWLAMRELARHHEHRSRDFGAALTAVDLGLDRVREVRPDLSSARVDFHRRRERLLQKLARPPARRG